MIGALTSWVDFSSFTTTSSESASYSFALLKRASWKQAMATLLISLVSKMRLPHRARGHEPSTSLEQASSKGGAWDHITANTLPWQATDWAPQLSSFPLTWHSECVLIFVSWTPTPITACGNATTHAFLLPLMPDEKSPFQQPQSYFRFTSIFSILPFCHSSCATAWQQLGYWLQSLLCVLLPAGYISLLCLAHFNSLGQPSFCSLPIQFPALRGTKALDITIWQIRGI